jgi:hypothetical protein
VNVAQSNIGQTLDLANEPRTMTRAVFGFITRLVTQYESVLIVAVYGMIMGGMQGWSAYIAPAELSDEYSYFYYQLRTWEGVRVAEWRGGQWQFVNNVTASEVSQPARLVGCCQR